MWKSAELGGDSLGLAPEMTCFLWYCRCVLCEFQSPFSFDWSVTRTIAWCSSDLKSFWCPWNAEAASSVMGWRTCYDFLRDKLVDYSRLWTELQELKEEQVQAEQEANEALEAEEGKAQEGEAEEGRQEGAGAGSSWDSINPLPPPVLPGSFPMPPVPPAPPIVGCVAKAGFPRPLLKTGSKPHLVALAVAFKMGDMTRAHYLIDLFLDCIQ